MTKYKFTFIMDLDDSDLVPKGLSKENQLAIKGIDYINSKQGSIFVENLDTHEVHEIDYYPPIKLS